MSTSQMILLILMLLAVLTILLWPRQQEPQSVPSVEVVSPIPDQSGPSIEVSYELIDSDGGPVSVLVEYSIDGSIFRPCTPTIDSDGIRELPATPSGKSYTFVWDMENDLQHLDAGKFKIRITPYKGPILGIPGVVGGSFQK